MQQRREKRVTKMKSQLLTICVNVFSLIVVSYSAAVPDILDYDSDSDIDLIAGHVCTDVHAIFHTNQQISRISTVVRLNHLVAESAAPKWDTCRQRFGESIKSLARLLQTSNQNVCSDEKLSLIEDFHSRFVSTTKEDKAKQTDEAPNLIRIFFLHYAMEVSAICRRGLINNLEWDISKLFQEQDYQMGEDNVFSRLLDGMAEQFGSMDKVNDYDDIILIWDLIKGSLYDKNNQQAIQKLQQQQRQSGGEDLTEEGVDQVTGESVKMLVKVKSPSRMQLMQQKCRNTFKPVYGKLILPIIRLSYLGYSQSGQRFEKELQELRVNPLVKRWYEITQICEAILPVRLFQDEALEANQVVMITKSEAAELSKLQSPTLEAASEELQQVEYEPTTNTMMAIDQLSSVETIAGQQLVKSINTNISARSLAIKRMLRRLLKKSKDFILNRAMSFLFSRKKNSNNNELQYVSENIKEVSSRSLAQLTEEELLNLEGGACVHRPIERRRRRQRKGDVDQERSARSEAISYMHTKSWSDIMAGFWANITVLAPSWPMLIMIMFFIMGLIIVAFHSVL